MDFDGHYTDSELEQLINKTSESVQEFEEIINTVIMSILTGVEADS